MSTKPTYEELAQTVLCFDKTLKNLYAALGAHPTSEKGDVVILLELLNPLWGVDNIVVALKEPTPEPEPAPDSNIQKYLENFDEHSFTDLLLRDMIDQEQRRQSKNCPEIQSREEIGEQLREGMEDTIGLAVMIVQALSYAAKGETK